MNLRVTDTLSIISRGSILITRNKRKTVCKLQTVKAYSKPNNQLTETPKTSDKATSSVSHTERI